ncbi:hypothetical protein, partial [Nocardioides sp.]|uniref:hypothetical protein n=1 Tax=Nocardioides sp. TaxID=35761 RepID=UPI0027339498
LAAGTVALAALVVAMAVRAGGADPDPVTDPTPTPTHTPLDVAPDAPSQAPELDGARTSDGSVRFTWTAPDDQQAGDSWQWTRQDTGESRRTTRTRQQISTPDRVCLEVRLIRGTFASPAARTCVD